MTDTKRIGLFVGLATLDVIQLIERMPDSDEKIRALNVHVAAGGPCSNAAVVFSALGGRADLVSRVSHDTVGEIVKSDLLREQVNLASAPTSQSTTVASILVTQETGQRAVISTGSAPSPIRYDNPKDLLPHPIVRYRVCQVDGYETDLALPLLEAAHEHGVFTMLDGGSFKEITPSLLPYLDCVIAGERFAPPDVEDGDHASVIRYLQSQGVPFCAVTRGSKTIIYATPTCAGEIPVAKARQVVDTLGAGDFFHGAFAYAVANRGNQSNDWFINALRYASEIASKSIESFGSRRWLSEIK